MSVPKIIDCTNVNSQERRQFTDHLRCRLIEFNGAFCSESGISPVLFAIRDGGEDPRGGLVGRIAWGWMHIEILWLGTELRGQGWGAKLLAKAENLARKHGCTGIYLDTFSFQAPEFYLRLGYQVFGKVDDFPQGHCRFFLQKRLRRG